MTTSEWSGTVSAKCSQNKVLSLLSVFVCFNTDLGLCGGFDLETCLWIRGLGPGVVYVVGPSGVWLRVFVLLQCLAVCAVGSVSLFYLIFFISSCMYKELMLQ